MMVTVSGYCDKCRRRNPIGFSVEPNEAWRLARWRKDRIGGTVWYLDGELAEGYADLEPALPRPGAMAKGTPTAH